jgi:hypothetical protein
MLAVAGLGVNLSNNNNNNNDNNNFPQLDPQQQGHPCPRKQ